jgi:hypothetical protein
MVEVGLLTPEAARRDRSRHVVTNSLGASGGVKGEINKTRLQDGDVVLLCTDGLTDLVDDGRIAEVLEWHPDPAAACDRLVDLALESGGRDNVTAVAARYSFLTPGDVRSNLFARRALVTGLFVKLLESIDGSAPHDEAEARRQLRLLGWSVDTVLPP